MANYWIIYGPRKYTLIVLCFFWGVECALRPSRPPPPAFKWTHFLSPCKSLCPVIWETIWRSQHPTKIWQGVDWRVWRVGCTPRKWVGRPGRGQGPRVRLSKTLLVQLNAKSQRNNDSQFWLWIHKYSSNLAYSSHDFRYPLTNSEIMNLFRGREGVPVPDASHEQFSN